MESQNPLEQAACEGHSQLFEELGIWSASPHPGGGGGGEDNLEFVGIHALFYVCILPEFYIIHNGLICTH